MAASRTSEPQTSARNGPGPALMWFRQDLRLGDNPALAAALASDRPVLGVYVLDDETPGKWAIGGAGRWWLHHSLLALSRDIEARGGRLILRRGPAEREILAFAREIGAGAVFWNRRYEPWGQAADAAIKAACKAAGLDAQSFNGALLHEPWTLSTAAKGPIKVYSAFRRAALAAGPAGADLPAPAAWPSMTEAPAGLALADLALLPTKPDWAGGLRATWAPGEASARARLEAFVSSLDGYREARNRLDQEGTSRLSPHLHWGEISPWRVWTAAEQAAAIDPRLAAGAEVLFNELLWREFSTHLMHHFPALPEAHWRPAFDAFAYTSADDPAIEAWRRGKTGYPLIDAAMNQLWVTGYMHNRARMAVGSFLVKHLLGDWRAGEAWFWDTLVDADLANNAASWQWVAGSGADAAPYFRIFNPILQGEKHDPTRAYVRQWLPELSGLPDSLIYRPWEASAETLALAGVRLGETYPAPIVEHAQARKRALEAYAAISARP